LAEMGKSPGPLHRLSAAAREGRCSAATLVSESSRSLDEATSLAVVGEHAADEVLREAKRIDEGDHPLGRLFGAPLLVNHL